MNIVAPGFAFQPRGLTEFQNWHSFETFSPDQVLMLSKLSQFPLYFCYFLVDILNFLLSALKLKIVFKFARTNLEMSKFPNHLFHYFYFKNYALKLDVTCDGRLLPLHFASLEEI